MIEPLEIPESVRLNPNDYESIKLIADIAYKLNELIEPHNKGESNGVNN